MAVPIRLALAVAAALACLAPAVSAQLRNRTEAQYLGGFHPQACRYPPEARRRGISACCQMDLDIGPDGRVLKSEGECTDPAFLIPTQRCLAVQSFVPATINGQPVRSLQSLEYEWRAQGQTTSFCRKLTS